MDFDFSTDCYQPHQFVRRARAYAQQSYQEVPPHILTGYLFDAVDALSYQLYTGEYRGTARYSDIVAARHVLYRAKCAIDRYLGTDEVGKRMAQYYQDLQERYRSAAVENDYRQEYEYRYEYYYDQDYSQSQEQIYNQNYSYGQIQGKEQQVFEPASAEEPFAGVGGANDASNVGSSGTREQSLDEGRATAGATFADSTAHTAEENAARTVDELQQQAELSNQKSMECLQRGAQKEGLEHLIRRNQALIRIAEANIGRGIDVDVNEKRIIQLQEFVGHVEAALCKM